MSLYASIVLVLSWKNILQKMNTINHSISKYKFINNPDSHCYDLIKSLGQKIYIRRNKRTFKNKYKFLLV